MNRLNFKYLYEAAKLGSMRAAADKLGVAVSSISRQIAQLEAELDVPLIEHGRRQVMLTEAGELTLRHYSEQLQQQEEFESQLADLKSLKSGRIKLAIGEGFVGEALSRIITRFTTRHAGVSLTVHMADSSNEVVRMVCEDEAHLGLVFNTTDDPRIRTQISTPQPLCAIVHRSHHLASRKSVTLSELASYRVCLLDSSLRTRQLLRQAEVAEGITLDPAVSSNSIGLNRDLVLSGEFVTLVSVLAVSQDIAKGELVAIPLDNPVLQELTPVTLVCRRGRRLAPGPVQLLLMLDGYLRGLPQYGVPEQGKEAAA